MPRNKSIHLQIFRVFSFIMVLVLFSLTIVTYIIFSNALRKTSIDALENVTKSIGTNIDSTIKNIDQTNLNVVYSYLIKNDFQDYSIESSKNVLEEDSDQTYRDEIERETVSEIVNMLIAIKGPSESTAQLAIHTLSGLTITTNNKNHFYTDLKEKSWFDSVLARDGLLYITKPYNGKNQMMSTDSFTDKSLISVCRVIFDGTNTPMGIAEAKQYSFRIFESLENSLENRQYESYIYNERGEIIFPYNLNDDQKHEGDYYLNQIDPNQTNGETESLKVKDQSSNSNKLICYTKMAYSDWTLLLIASERRILKPLYRLTRILLFISLLLAILSLFLSFIAARKITIPIKTLSDKIHNFEIEHGYMPLNLESGINEIEDLNDAFSKMNGKIKESLDSILLLQNQDMQSKMLALQSQISPHFIYNSLSIISVMAEEKMNSGIIEMSSSISDILRYTSSDDTMFVPIEVEVENTHKYLTCMKYRFQEKLKYKINSDLECSKFKIPKLSIQPLIENSLKYATKKAPPWIISIDITENENGFRVKVNDNGSGFDEAVLKSLKEKMGLIDLQNILPNMNLEGMGLMNIYIRLKILYTDNLVFEIENNESGGSSIIFGSDRHASVNKKNLENLQSILDGDNHA